MNFNKETTILVTVAIFILVKSIHSAPAAQTDKSGLKVGESNAKGKQAKPEVQPSAKVKTSNIAIKPTNETEDQTKENKTQEDKKDKERDQIKVSDKDAKSKVAIGNITANQKIDKLSSGQSAKQVEITTNDKKMKNNKTNTENENSETTNSTAKNESSVIQSKDNNSEKTEINNDQKKLKSVLNEEAVKSVDNKVTQTNTKMTTVNGPTKPTNTTTKTSVTIKDTKEVTSVTNKQNSEISQNLEVTTNPTTTQVQTTVDPVTKSKSTSKKLESKSTVSTKKVSPRNRQKERRTNVRRNVITTSTTTQSTVTEYETATTWDGLPCSSRFRAHPVDKTKFETAFSENVFEKIYQSCPAPLEWRQDQCRCGWAEPEVIETCNCCAQGLKAHPDNSTMYLRLVNGQWLDESCSSYDNNQLWDDEKCSCIWDPSKPQSHKAPVFKGAVLPRLMTKCMNLVNMTLDEGLKDADGRDLTPVFGRQRIRVVDENGDIGKSIEIRRAPFKLGIFNGNDLQSTVYFKFNFKVHKDKVRMRNKMVIMSNGCKRRWQRKEIEPSLEVSFFPYNETFEIRFSTTGKTVVEYMTGTKDANGWYQCVLYLQDRILNLKVNGQKIYSTNGMSGRVKSTDCPLTVAGSPTDAKNHFDGYLDELQVVKQCKYEPDVQ